MRFVPVAKHSELALRQPAPEEARCRPEKNGAGAVILSIIGDLL